MSLDVILAFPFGNITTVSPKIMTAKILKIISNRNNVLDNSLPFKVIAAISNLSESDARNLTSYDARRILGASFIVSYGTNTYSTMKYCQCGQVNPISHNLDYKKISLDKKVYRVHSFEMPTGEKYEVEICPMMLKTESEILRIGQQENNTSDLIDLYFWCMVKSINGKINFDKDEVPMPIFRQIQKIIQEEQKKTLESFQKIIPCLKCKESISSDISWADSEFLAGGRQ